jgi:hypothetical protein
MWKGFPLLIKPGIFPGCVSRGTRNNFYVKKSLAIFIFMQELNNPGMEI